MCFKLPKSFTTKLDHLQRDFWWGLKENGKKPLYLKSWQTITQPKRQGGLRLKNMETQNNALIAKTIWRMLTHPDSLTAKVMGNIYQNSIQALQNRHIKGNGSWIWNSFVEVFPLRKNHICWEVSNGKNIKIWEDIIGY